MPRYPQALPWPFPTSLEKTIFPINGPVWSLFFELFANGVFLAVARARRFRAAAWGLLLAGGAALAAYALHLGSIDVGPYLGTWPGGFPRVLYGFFAGVLLSVVRPALPTLPVWVFPLLLLGICQVPATHDTANTAFDLIVVFFVFPLLVGSARNSVPHRRLADLCALAGDVSYPVYAIHYPLVRAICFVLNRHPPGLAGRVAACAATVLLVSALGWLAFRFYDQPVRRALSRPSRARALSASM